MNPPMPIDPHLIRLPGLFRRYEIERVIGVGVDFRIEPAGFDCDGVEFFAVYRREPGVALSDLIPALNSQHSKPTAK